MLLYCEYKIKLKINLCNNLTQKIIESKKKAEIICFFNKKNKNILFFSVTYCFLTL